MRFGPLISLAPAGSSSAAMRSTSPGSATQKAIRFSLGTWPGLSVTAKYAVAGSAPSLVKAFHVSLSYRCTNPSAGRSAS